MCCNSWAHKEPDTTQRLNCTELTQLGKVFSKKKKKYLKYSQSIFSRLLVDKVQIHRASSRFQIRIPHAPPQSTQRWSQSMQRWPGLGRQEIKTASLWGPLALFPIYCFNSDYFWKQDNGLLATEFSSGACWEAVERGYGQGAAADRNSPVSPAPRSIDLLFNIHPREFFPHFREDGRNSLQHIYSSQNQEVKEKEFC